MTQIFTLLTPQCVVQVSDRRVTYPGPPLTFRDVENKAVAYLTLAAFGYTGVAEVGGRTDVWMTEILGPTAGLRHAFQGLAEAATREFQAPRLRGQPLLMVAGGWNPSDERGTNHQAFYATIGNCHASGGHPRIQERRATRSASAIAIETFGPPRDTFDWRVEGLQEWMCCLIHVAGQPLNPGRERPFMRTIKRAVVARLAPPTLVRILAEEMWRVAARNPKVGSSLMAVSIPRSAARTSGPITLVSGPPTPDHVSSMYLPSPDASPIYYMANLAGAGTCMVDAQVEPA